MLEGSNKRDYGWYVLTSVCSVSVSVTTRIVCHGANTNNEQAQGSTEKCVEWVAILVALATVVGK